MRSKHRLRKAVNRDRHAPENGGSDMVVILPALAIVADWFFVWAMCRAAARNGEE